MQIASMGESYSFYQLAAIAALSQRVFFVLPGMPDHMCAAQVGQVEAEEAG